MCRIWMIHLVGMNIIMSLQLSVNLEFLEKLDPPSNWPPAEEELTSQLENRFLAQCDRFISNQRALYRCSKAVEGRLNRILTSSQDIERTLAAQRDKMDFIAHELAKYKDQECTLRERQRVLRMLCELVRMEELRKDLLVNERKEPLEEESRPPSIDQHQYLLKLQRLTRIIGDSQALATLKDSFPLVREIVQELQAIAGSANKLIAKRLLTPKMAELVVTEFYPLFANGGEVLAAVVAHRLQNMRISLNPLINSLNYVANTAELFESIFSNWTELLARELIFFRPCGRLDLVRSINSQLMNELLPRIEKSLFKVKELVGLVHIRKAYSQFQKALERVEGWGERREGEWQAVSAAVSKCQALIGSRLTEEAEFLESSKYNIHTMASYIPIRQHLEKVKACYELSVEGEKLDWEVGFYSLCTSRYPKNDPNNKSLLIFNLNIWYLYIKLLPNGKHREEGEQLLKWCSATFTKINVQEAKKRYYDSFEKVLELCGNLPAFKAILYAEVHLLGHEDLRREITKDIRAKYVESYQQTLTKIQQAPMNHEEVKAFCQARKINLNKFGKHSHALCVLSPNALAELLEQP